MSRKLAAVIWPLFLLMAFFVSAGNRFERFTIDQGLSQNTVTSVLQDSQGFLWVGTQNGLNRYDGYKFRTFYYDAENINSLSSSYVFALIEDRNGHIWIGTLGGGLNRFDPVTEKFERFKHKENGPGDQVSALFQSNDGSILIGTFRQGLSVYNHKADTFETFVYDANNPNSLSNNNVWEITQDSKGRIWVATATGLNLFNPTTKQFTRYVHSPEQANSLSDSRVMSLYPDKLGNLWVGTSGGGVNYFEPDTGHFTRYRHDKDDPSSLSNDLVRTVLVDNDDNVWVGTDQGLNRFIAETGGFEHFKHDKEDKHSIPGNVIQTLTMSNDNLLWVGNYATGLAKYNPIEEQFVHIKHQAKVAGSLPGNDVWGLAQGKDGTVWVAMDGTGLASFDQQTKAFTRYRHDPDDPLSISSDRVYAVIFDGQGRLWTANYDGGANRFDATTKTFKRYLNNPNEPNSLSTDVGLCLFVDNQQQLWIGTYGGLNRYNPDTDNFTRFLHDPNNANSLSNSAILTVTGDQQDNLWVGTYGGGLNRIDSEMQFTRYRHDANNPDSLSHDMVNTLLPEKNGNLWVGTFGGGLNLLDIKSGKFTRYGIKEGLNSLAIYSLVYDKAGKLWIATAKGMSVFDDATGQFINYNEQDGIIKGGFNHESVVVSADGEMWFGGAQGINRFYPDKIKRPQFDMPVSLTQLRVSNKVVEVGAKNHHGKPYLTQAINYIPAISLGYLDGLFAFEFAALGFADPTSTQYAYMLENWDNSWINTTFDNRLATYTNIPPGDYTLKVKARGPDADWGSQVAKLQITITPAPWKTWWAYSVYLLVISLIIGSFMWQRHQKFRQVRASQRRLSLALWSSGNELWDWNKKTNRVLHSGYIHTAEGTNHIELFDVQKLKSQVHEDDFEQVWQGLISHINNRTEFIDVTYRVRDGKDNWRWVRNRAKAVERGEDGKALRIIGTIDDIQELKQTQSDLLVLNQELENRVAERTAELSQAFESLKTTQKELVESEKLAALGGLVVGIAHELNTPLGITVTAATEIERSINRVCAQKNQQTLTKAKFDQFEQSAKEGMTLLLNNLHRTDRLIQDFKALAFETHSETGKPFDVLSLLESLRELKQQHFAQHHIDMQVECEQNVTLVSHVDAVKMVIEQLINNSITHAFEAVAAPRVSIRVFELNNQIKLQYSDNGKGLSIDALGRIFEPFYTTKRGSECTGLGMLIVHNLVVHKLSGSIGCESEPGLGLTVTITLPQSL